jgi:hypothetical protein
MFKIFVEQIFKMKHLEVSGAVRHIYICIYVVRLLRVNRQKIKNWREKSRKS